MEVNACNPSPADPFVQPRLHHDVLSIKKGEGHRNGLVGKVLVEV